MTDTAGTNGARPGDGSRRRPYGYVASNNKDALVNRMRRIEGQARGIEKMITEDRYCIDILTQIAAVSTALETVAGILLDDHVNHCVRGALTSGDEEVAAEKTRELLEAVRRFIRTRSGRLVLDALGRRHSPGCTGGVAAVILAGGGAGKSGRQSPSNAGAAMSYRPNRRASPGACGLPPKGTPG